MILIDIIKDYNFNNVEKIEIVVNDFTMFFLEKYPDILLNTKEEFSFKYLLYQRNLVDKFKLNNFINKDNIRIFLEDNSIDKNIVFEIILMNIYDLSTTKSYGLKRISLVRDEIMNFIPNIRLEDVMINDNKIK